MYWFALFLWEMIFLLIQLFHCEEARINSCQHFLHVNPFEIISKKGFHIRRVVRSWRKICQWRNRTVIRPNWTDIRSDEWEIIGKYEYLTLLSRYEINYSNSCLRFYRNEVTTKITSELTYSSGYVKHRQKFLCNVGVIVRALARPLGKTWSF